MKFTQEHEMFRQMVRRFVEEEINPHVEEWEEAGIFPAHDLFKKMGAQERHLHSRGIDPQIVARVHHHVDQDLLSIAAARGKATIVGAVQGALRGATMPAGCR